MSSTAQRQYDELSFKAIAGAANRASKSDPVYPSPRAMLFLELHGAKTAKLSGDDTL